MNLPLSKNKKGFTIIEVALVLAVGGLIMLMVFIAWPAVQRNQKDSQRRTVDLPRLYTALTNYMTNNSGSLPTKGMGTGTNVNVIITGAETAASVTGTGTGNADWKTFYTNYMLAEGDTFVDPVGTPYNLSITYCANNGTAAKPNATISTVGNACTATYAKTPTAAGGSTLMSGGTINATFDNQASTITIVIGASCQGEKAVAATKTTGGTRKFAVMYKLESGGVFCQSN